MTSIAIITTGALIAFVAAREVDALRRGNLRLARLTADEAVRTRAPRQ